MDPDFSLRALNPVKKAKFLWFYTRKTDTWATMRDMASHNVIKKPLVILFSVHRTQGSPCPERWEGGEEEVIWAHGCLGPQVVQASSKAQQQLGTGPQIFSAHCKGGNLTLIPLTDFHSSEWASVGSAAFLGGTFVFLHPHTTYTHSPSSQIFSQGCLTAGI